VALNFQAQRDTTVNAIHWPLKDIEFKVQNASFEIILLGIIISDFSKIM
jgi:hypothetical protein